MKKDRVMQETKELSNLLMIFAVVLLCFSAVVTACLHPPCDPCYYWDEETEQCVWRCSSGEACCGAGLGNCYNTTTTQCCDQETGHTCPKPVEDWECCNGSCCYTKNNCYKGCIDGSCKYCNPGEICCNDSCCDGKCCNDECKQGCTGYCCNDSTNNCCDMEEECCLAECCDDRLRDPCEIYGPHMPAEECCNGTCCNNHKLDPDDPFSPPIEECCDGACCDNLPDPCDPDSPKEHCCSDIPGEGNGYCCPNGKTCCNGNCCDSDTGECCYDGLCQDPKCDNCHPVGGTLYECGHHYADPEGHPCNLYKCIKNVISTASCTYHENNPCPSNCRAQVAFAGPEVVQTSYYVATCFSDPTVTWTTWKTIRWSDCSICPGGEYRKACETTTPCDGVPYFEHEIGLALECGTCP
jgi:hypothetical protein